jgi:hypothetical protein
MRELVFLSILICTVTAFSPSGSLSRPPGKATRERLSVRHYDSPSSSPRPLFNENASSHSSQPPRIIDGTDDEDPLEGQTYADTVFGVVKVRSSSLEQKTNCLTIFIRCASLFCSLYWRFHYLILLLSFFITY